MCINPRWGGVEKSQGHYERYTLVVRARVFPDSRSRPVRLVTPEGTVRVDGCLNTLVLLSSSFSRQQVSTGLARHTRRYSESGRV